MKRFIIASHYKFAKGFKETLKFLTTIDDIYDISADVEENEKPLENQIQQLFETFNPEDKVIVLTDILYGSVNQKFIPYMNEHVFIVTGANIPIGLALILENEENITYDFIDSLVNDARNNLIFVNSINVVQNDDDE